MIPRLSGDSAPIILGSAQFGMVYGITNHRGQVLEGDVRAILAGAQEAQIRVIDTASAYGASEQLLGRVLIEFPCFEVISKIPALRGDSVTGEDISSLKFTVSRSLELLRRDRLHALLVHSCVDLFKLGGERLVKFLEELRRDRVVSRIGVSIYEASEVDRLLEIFTPDIVQMPLNLFDQRLFQSGHVAKLQAAGVEVHGRSAFLQGVLLSDIAKLPGYFERFSHVFGAYSNFLEKHSLSRLAACLGFALCRVDKVVIGVTERRELDEIIEAVLRRTSMPAMDALACSDRDLIDPRRWPAAPHTEIAGSA